MVFEALSTQHFIGVGQALCDYISDHKQSIKKKVVFMV